MTNRWFNTFNDCLVGGKTTVFLTILNKLINDLMITKVKLKLKTKTDPFFH